MIWPESKCCDPTGRISKEGDKRNIEGGDKRKMEDRRKDIKGRKEKEIIRKIPLPLDVR